MADLSKATRLQVPGLLGHDERTSENHTNEKIDPTRTWMNYNFISEVSLERYQRRMSEVYCLNRKNVNTLAMVSVTLPKEVKPEDQDRFFKVVFEHFKNQFGEQNVVSAFVHLDETTPHIHIKAIPVYLNEKNKQEQVSFDEVCPRNFYRRFHKDLSEVVEKELGYPTGILNGATEEGNKSIKQLKAMTALQEVNKELQRALNEAKDENDEIRHNLKGVLATTEHLKERLAFEETALEVNKVLEDMADNGYEEEYVPLIQKATNSYWKHRNERKPVWEALRDTIEDLKKTYTNWVEQMTEWTRRVRDGRERER